MGNNVLQHHTHGHVHQVAVVGLTSKLALDQTEAGEVDAKFALVTTIFQTGSRQFLTLDLLQLALLRQQVHDNFGRTDRVERVGGRVEAGSLEDQESIISDFHLGI